MDLERVVLAELIRPRGNRGELLAISQTDVPGRLENLRAAWVQLADGSDIRIEIERAWQHNHDWVLKFVGVDSIDGAERFRHADVWVPRAERADLPAGDWYQTDLIGCAVVDLASGTILGKVAGWQQYGGPPLLELTVSGREVLVPFVPEICPEVDLEARQIRVKLPEGLLEL